MTALKTVPANCFTCQYPVFEFEDDKFGCEHCKAIWVYVDGAWINETKKKKRDGRRNIRDNDK